MFERMAYYGISSNLVLYQMTKLHQGTVSSVNNVTNWVGTIWMTPILGAYIVDAHLGRYRTFMIASLIYLIVSLYLYAIFIFIFLIVGRRDDDDVVAFVDIFLLLFVSCQHCRWYVVVC